MSVGYITLSKNYSASYYSSAWFAGDTLTVQLYSEDIKKTLDSGSGNLLVKKPRSKSGYINGIQTDITDLLKVDFAFTITGFIEDTGTRYTSTLSSDGTTIELTGGDYNSFPSTNGVILIDNELIHYDTRSGTTLSTLRRAYAHTTEVAHTGGVTVTDMTNSAIIKEFNMEQLRTRGGTVTFQYRMFTFTAFISSFDTTDNGSSNKTINDLPTKYPFNLSLIIGTMRGE